MEQKILGQLQIANFHAYTRTNDKSKCSKLCLCVLCNRIHILSYLRGITLQAEYSPASFSLSADREYILLEYSTLQVRVDISRYQVILTLALQLQTHEI